jgi:hypothetical protein
MVSVIIFFNIFSIYMYTKKFITVTMEHGYIEPNTVLHYFCCYTEPRHLYFLLYGAFAVFLFYQPRYMLVVALTMLATFLLKLEEGPGYFLPDGRWHQLWPTSVSKSFVIYYHNDLQVEYLPQVLLISFIINFFFDYQRYRPIVLLASFSLVVACVFLLGVDDYIVHKTNYIFLWEIFKDKFFWAVLLTVLLIASVAPKIGVVLFFTVVYKIQYFYILIMILILFGVFVFYTFFLIAVLQSSEDLDKDF